MNLSPSHHLFKDAARYYGRFFTKELPGWNFSPSKRQQLAASRRLYLHSLLAAALYRAEAEALRLRGAA